MSRLPGFHRLELEARQRALQELGHLSAQDLSLLRHGGLSPEAADRLIENVIGVYGLPLGIGTNLQVNGRDVLVPMVVEEPSVVAALSNGARLARSGGGFAARAAAPIMRGQLQLMDVADPDQAVQTLLAHTAELLSAANAPHHALPDLGGGARSVEAHPIMTRMGPMVILELCLDVRDAMGANAVNTSMEAVAPLAEQLSGGRAVVRVLTNLADDRLAAASCRIPLAELALGVWSGEAVGTSIVEASAFAEVDAHRAATHNKGIMNGIDAVALATGNDWRAIEAGAHAYAARSGRYAPLSSWAIEGRELVGQIELPLAVGTVGGATKAHPLAQTCLHLMGMQGAGELAEIMAAVGLAQNLAALRALATEGIQRGHMQLHRRHGEGGTSC